MMTRPDIHAALATVDYASLDAHLGCIAEATDDMAELLSRDNDEAREVFRLALPSLMDVERRALVLAASVRRLRDTIKEDGAA